MSSSTGRSALARRLEVLRSSSPASLPRLVYRKFVHRFVTFGRLGMRAGDAVAPSRPCPYRIEFLGPDRYGVILDESPYLNQHDVDDFRRNDAKCIVVYDGDRIAANSWMVRGSVFVPELQRSITLLPREHFSCRSFVHPDYRGASLFGHMIYAYSAAIDPDDEVWGLVLDQNVASLLTLEKLGWRKSGDYSTRFLLGLGRPREVRYPPLPPQTYVPEQ